MPTTAGIPIPIHALPGGVMNQWDFIDVGPAGSIGGIQQSAIMRGSPGAFMPYQARQIPGPQTAPMGGPVYLTSPQYSRGAEAHAPKFGLIPVNPIGSGVYAPYRIPTISGPGARYEFAAIWFNVQSIPTSLLINPSIPIESVDALIASSYVGGMYVTTG